MQRGLYSRINGPIARASLPTHATRFSTSAACCCCCDTTPPMFFLLRSYFEAISAAVVRTPAQAPAGCCRGYARVSRHCCLALALGTGWRYRDINTLPSVCNWIPSVCTAGGVQHQNRGFDLGSFIANRRWGGSVRKDCDFCPIILRHHADPSTSAICPPTPPHIGFPLTAEERTAVQERGKQTRLEIPRRAWDQ